MPYICSRSGSGTYHCVVGDYNLVNPVVWSTRCGWRYHLSSFVRVPELPALGTRERFCDKCLPETVIAGLVADGDGLH